MAPLMWRLGVLPHGLPWPRAAMLIIGASTVFPFLMSMGLAYAPASDGGALPPGTLPFCAAVVFSRFISGLFRALFAMKEIWNGKEMHS